jgi:predicted DNA-binding antitoxin AbrB/MazE fold protein
MDKRVFGGQRGGILKLTLIRLVPGARTMTITVEAVYENGVLKPAQPLPLKEHERVRVTVVQEPSVTRQTYGLMGWTGDAAILERFALDPELDPQEST